LKWNTWVRQIHHWLSIGFTVAVLVNIVALGQEQQPAVWVGLLALLPVALLLLTGLYLFAIPYATQWRSATRQRVGVNAMAKGRPPDPLSFLELGHVLNFRTAHEDHARRHQTRA